MRNILFSTLAILSLIGVGCPSPNVASSPMSGTWSFEIASANLTGSGCPSQGAMTFGSHGEAELAVSAPGELAVMNLDGQQLVFHRQIGNGSSYKTNTRLFPTGQSGAGSVYFDFVAQTSETISGDINWNNNDGCVGTYPFAMELIEPELSGDPETIVQTLSEGDWNLAIEDIQDNCTGASIASFTGLPSSISLSSVVDLDTGEPSTDEFYVEPLGFTIQQIPDTNIYSQTGAPFDIGLPMDSDGDVMFDFEDQSFDGALEIQAGQDNTATGQIYVTGDSCGAMMTISLTGL